MNHDIRHILTSAILLGAFGIVGAGTVALVFDNTEERIEENIRMQLLESLNQIMPHGEYDNDIINDTIEVWNASLTPGQATVVYRARKGGEPVAAIFTSTAPDGYNGAIRLLIGIRNDGTLAGVRVVQHHETPGLGDAIDLSKSEWVLGFNGKGIGHPPIEHWKVKRDGGAFDQFTGATITPRAVVKSVRNTLLYFNEHRDEIFQVLNRKEEP